MLHRLGKQTNEEAIQETKKQIDDAEDRIETFKAECIKAESFYLTQIENSKAQIKKLQSLRKEEMQNLKKEHEDEIQAAENKEEKEIEEIKNRISEHSDRNTGYKTHKNGLQRAMKEAELEDLRHQVEVAKMEKEECDLEKRTKIRNFNTKNLKEIQDLTMKIESLKADISDIKSTIQTNKLQALGKKRETELKFQLRSEENEKNIKAKEDELEQKRIENEELVKKAQQAGSRKISHYQKELQGAQDQIKLMASLQEKLRRKYANEMSSMKENVESAREAVNVHTERLQQQQDEVLERERKVNEILKENMILSETIKSLNTDIAKTKRENKTLKRESSLIETQIYTERIGSVRSTSFF